MGASKTIVQSVPNAPPAPYPQLPSQALDCLRRLAIRYVWWKTPEEAMHFPHRVAAQVMNLGTWEDWVAMWEATGDEYLRSVLQHAEAGQLDARSWHYWHYRLGLAEYPNCPVPPMPVREFT
ncbi:MAG TPA: hypothetical protein VF730_11550 [Terracidiphilus sp.]